MTSRVDRLLTSRATKLLDRNHLYSSILRQCLALLPSCDWSMDCLCAHE